MVYLEMRASGEVFPLFYSKDQADRTEATPTRDCSLIANAPVPLFPLQPHPSLPQYRTPPPPPNFLSIIQPHNLLPSLGRLDGFFRFTLAWSFLLVAESAIHGEGPGVGELEFDESGVGGCQLVVSLES